MSVEAHEEPKKKKSKKALWITLLILLLIPIIAVGGYLFMINKAWNKSETFDNAMPNEDGTVTTPHNDELQALVDQAANATITNESGATLESNVSEGDANGDGILDAVAGGAVTEIGRAHV